MIKRAYEYDENEWMVLLYVEFRCVVLIDLNNLRSFFGKEKLINNK